MMFLGNLLLQGGWMMAPILICSLASLTIFIYKWLEFHKAQLSDMSWFKHVLHILSATNAATGQSLNEAVDGSNHPATRVVHRVIQVHKEKPEHTKAEGRRIGSLELQKLEKYLPTLAFLAEIAPLLGLLGTVIGMIDMFTVLQSQAQTNISVEVLSSGIYKALLTTAAGLAVAVPTLAGHRFLSSKSDALRLQLSSVIQQVLYKLSDQNENEHTV